MSATSNHVVIAVLSVIGRFLYRLLLAVTIVWVAGLAVGALLPEGPGGGVSALVP
jgi:hypothetical protein